MNTTFRTLVAMLACLGVTGCFNFDGAYGTYLACFDGGPCTPDAGPGDAGVVVEDAGAPDAGPVAYDGGASCNGSANRRLKCDAPMVLGSGTGIGSAAMAASGNGFIVAWAGATVEVREVSLDGGVLSLMTGVPATSAQLSVDAKGPRWAVSWVDQNATAMKCVTNTNSAQVLASLDDGGVLDVPMVAITASGAVALSAKNADHLLAASSLTGCPSRFTPLPIGTVNGVGVVATSAAGDEGFRYVWTDQINAYNGSVGMLTQTDGGVVAQTSIPSNFRAPQSLGVAVSTSGATVFTAYSAITTTDTYDLNLWASSADLSGDGALTNISSVDPGWWAVGACGEGCMATGVIAYGAPGPATVRFFSDDANAVPGHSWDVACALQPQMNDGSTLSVAGFGGRLGVLLTSRSTAKLYVCDLPPER